MSLTDQAVQDAAAALYQHLTSAGCKPGFDSTVQAFQQAYVNAGGSLPADSGGRSGVDGLYGANTRTALQQVLNVGVLQPPPAAPAGCVTPSAPQYPVTPSKPSTTPTTPAAPIAPLHASILGLSPTAWLVGLAVLAAGVVGIEVAKKHKGGKKARRGKKGR